MRWRYGILAALILLALSPILWTFAAGGIAALAGCEITPVEGDPCRILGADWAPALRFGIVSGWLGIYLMPVAALFLALLLVMALVDLIRYLRR